MDSVQLVTTKQLQVMSGRANLELAEEIAANLGVELCETNLSDFANGEIHCRFGQSIRGADVFIIQSHAALEERSINDAVIEQLVMVDAARRASAKRVTAVCPFFPYARQDRKAEGREPISAKLMANLLAAAGAGRAGPGHRHAVRIRRTASRIPLTNRGESVPPYCPASRIPSWIAMAGESSGS